MKVFIPSFNTWHSIFSTSFGMDAKREAKSNQPASRSAVAATGFRLKPLSIFLETSSTDLGSLHIYWRAKIRQMYMRVKSLKYKEYLYLRTQGIISITREWSYEPKKMRVVSSIPASFTEKQPTLSLNAQSFSYAMIQALLALPNSPPRLPQHEHTNTCMTTQTWCPY